MQPRDPGHPNGSLLRALLLGFGMVQTEPNFQGHGRNESGNRFRSTQFCRPQVKRVGSTGVVFLVGEQRHQDPRALVSGTLMPGLGANDRPSGRRRR